MSEEKFDTHCPYVKLLAEDMLRTPEAYYRCQANCRGREPGEFGEPTDYYKCDSENHKECYYYKKEKGLEEEVKK